VNVDCGINGIARVCGFGEAETSVDRRKWKWVSGLAKGSLKNQKVEYVCVIRIFLQWLCVVFGYVGFGHQVKVTCIFGAITMVVNILAGIVLFLW